MRLPDVTLITIETRAHELARMAIEDTLKVADFGEVIIFTDKSKKIQIPGASYVMVEDWQDKIGWAHCYWHLVPHYIKTSHALLIQWDSWALDPEMWKNEFLNFDYLGSPWFYLDGLNVGNSGFGMRSKTLMSFLAKHETVYPVTSWAEDALLCRVYRRQLEKVGFKWAPQDLALDFSFECVRRSPTSRHFGFHDVKNWPAVLSPERLQERLDIGERNEYFSKENMAARLNDGFPVYLGGTDDDGNWIFTLRDGRRIGFLCGEKPLP